MAGNTWVILAVLMLCQGLGSIGRNSGQGAKQERFNVQNVCLKNNLITIASGGFGIILKPCNSSGQENCTFVFDNSSTIRHGHSTYTFEYLQFWMIKDSEQWYFDVKEKRRIFNVTLCGAQTGCSHTVDPANLCEKVDYEKCKGPGDASFRFRINLTTAGPDKCVKCGNPVPVASTVDTSSISAFKDLIESSPNSTESSAQTVDPAKASKVMQALSSVLEAMGNLTLASISVGPVKGVMVKPEDEEDLKRLSFVSENDLNLIEDEDKLKEYPLSLTVSKEAYKKAFDQDKNKTFVGVFRFPNMTGENVTALTGQVYGIDMGTNIANLSEPIQIKYNRVSQKQQEEFNLSCQSWDGEGDQPNWTAAGCYTNISDIVTCECSHLTFFAVLMTPLEKDASISASDLTSLTYISYIGCGVSLFFLGIALFMFFCIRRATASNAIHILIHLLLALFLLNTSFLTNEWIANLENAVACKVIAGFMHYSMLCSFTWFAVEAFHLCLQLTSYATVSIPNYKLKLCCVGWIPGALVVLILFSVGKYGELKLYADNGSVARMCWILDGRLQYGVNIGYYAIVFAFTFTIFVVMLRWLCYLRGSKVKKSGGEKQSSTRSQDVVTIMGLCCMLGITWSFAFFSHGPLRVPSFYIFTILNSLQGFFLFLYYYNTSRIIGDGDTNTSSSSSSSTKTSISNEDTSNPYM